MGPPSLVLLPPKFQQNFFELSFPLIRQVGDHTDFVQEEEPFLQCWTIILAICVVVDVSRCLDILTWEF